MAVIFLLQAANGAYHGLGLRLTGMRQNDDELIAPDAGRHPSTGGAALQDAGSLLQQSVPGRMTDGIVNQLESIKVDNDDARLGQGAVTKLALKVAPIVDASQGVMPTEELHLRLFFFALGDVAGQHQDSGRAIILHFSGIGLQPP